MLDEEDADAVSLSLPVVALGPTAVASPMMGDVWSVSRVMVAWELVRCNK
jgi:hypothetical protein